MEVYITESIEKIYLVDILENAGKVVAGRNDHPMTPKQIENWLNELDAASAASYAKAENTRITPKYRAPIDAATLAKMRHMRREGFTISEIARAAKCTWRTAWARTKGFSV